MDFTEPQVSSHITNGRPHCVWCQKIVGRRAIKHSNPAFPDPTLLFCSVECHNQWCYAQATKE